MSEAKFLNECLAGTPYLVPEDNAGEKRAGYLIAECQRVFTLNQTVSESFEQQSEAIQNRLQHMIRTQRVYESNALELTGLPLDETKREIEKAGDDPTKLASHISRLAIHSDKHLIDVLGLHQANLFGQQLVNDYLDSSMPLREIDIRSLHRQTVPKERFAGAYRDIEVGIEGSDHEPPAVFEVPRSMAQLVGWISTTAAPPPLAAAVAHSWLAAIHPFQDGNGRVARLLANVVLLRNRWPPLIVRESDRLQYLDALSTSDHGGDLLPLFDLFVKWIRSTLKDLSRPELAQELFEADLGKRHDDRHALWSDLLTQFLDALRVELGQDMEVHRLRVPPKSTLMRLENGDPTGNTWLAKVRGREGKDLLLWLGHATHYMVDNWSFDRPPPVIFVSKRDRSPEPIHPYLNPLRDGSPVRFDEIALVPTVGAKAGLIRYGMNVYDKTIPELASQVARALESSDP